MENLYEKYGGDGFWESLLDQFYEKNMSDPKLQNFFEGKDMVKIKRMNKHLLSSALRATQEYSSVDLRQIHSKFGIKLDQFNRFLLNFYNTLTSHGISEEDVEYMLVVIDIFKEDIVS